MFYRFILTFIFILLLASSGFSQAKVGTVGAQFLNISPDVRANGMGHAGVALTDSYSGYFNPAVTAMINSEKRFNISLGYLDMPADIDVYSLSFTAKIVKPDNDSGSGFHLGAGFYMVKLTTGDMIERTYEQGPGTGTGREFRADDISYNFSLGAGFSTFIDVSAGVTLKFIKEEYADEEADGTAFDFGFLVSKNLGAYLFKDYINDKCNWIFRPSLGVAFTNFGPDMEMVQQEYPLPNKWSYGLALEIAREKLTSTGTLRQISIIPAIAIVDYLWDDYEKSYTGCGLELGLFEAVYLRAGTSDSEDIDNTLGFSVNSRGLVYLLGAGNSTPGSLGYFFREKIKIAFNYAREEMWELSSSNYYGLNISF